MPRPGTQIDIVDGAPFGGAVLDSGQAFFVGVSERGPVGAATLLTSQADYEDIYGLRTGGSLLYDAVGAYFAEGGAVLYVSRVSGPLATTAQGVFGSATAKAASPGAWGNAVKVDAVAPPTTLAARVTAASSGYDADDGDVDPQAAGAPIAVTVSYNGVIVERSGALTTVDDLVLWASEHSDYVRVVKGADNILAASGTSVVLAGGVTDNALTAPLVQSALAVFTYELGPGQVAAPGLTTLAYQTAILAHADSTRRNGVIDLPDSSDPTVLSAAVAALVGLTGQRVCAAFGPWVNYPSQAVGAAVQVPYSAIECGLIARNDAATNNPNAPAAGVNGVSRMALGVTQHYSDAVREALNDAGVNVAIVKYGDVRTYGYRTIASSKDDNWVWFGNSREINALAHEADAIAENYVLSQIDGQGATFARLHNALKGLCLEHYGRGALYGATPSEAFRIVTDSSVNTPTTIANGEIHAVIYVKTSPAAEWVQISIVKVPVDRALEVV